jgi:hypothetical protein
MPENTYKEKCFGGPQKFPIRPRAHPVWARTTWREARAESTEAQRGIIHTVVNRAAKAGWWGTDVVSVSLKLFQFSSLNLNDPRRCTPNEVAAAILVQALVVMQ